MPKQFGEHDGTSEPIKAVPVRRNDDFHKGGFITLSYTGVQYGYEKSVRRAGHSATESVPGGKLRLGFDRRRLMAPPTRVESSQLPFGIRELPDPPAELFLTGRLPPGPRVAVVGTRRPTVEAVAFAEQLALELAQAGVVVVSGGALGIDTAAHVGALRAGAGTLVVAPSSYCCPYPEENKGLFRQIVEQGGGYLTPFGQPMHAQRHAFFARNGLLVSLCSVVVLVQAPHRSGARNAVLWARRLKRPYWVVPHPPWCSAGACSVAELRLGGMPLSSAKDVMTWLAARNEHAVPIDAQAEHGGAGGEEPCDREPTTRVRGNDGGPTSRSLGQDGGTQRDVCRLVAALNAGPKHPDELCEVLGWSPAQLHATVLHATLMGEAERLTSGRIGLGSHAARV